jgi:tetratricopeptide (TPR) repeat protein
MAVVLATAGTLAVTAMPQEAQAQKKKKEKDSGVNISKEVRPKVAAIQAAMATETPETAKPLVEALLAETLAPDDRFVAGQLAIQLGGTLKDTGLQEKGILASLDSGRTGPEQLPAFNFFAGNFAYGAERWADAAKWFQAAYDLGYRANNIEPLLAETFFKRNMYTEGLAKWDEIIKNANASATKAPESWYRLARDRALASKDKNLYATWATKWASAYPSGDSWGDAVAATRWTSQSDAVQNLELLRFMKATDSLKTTRDYKEFAEEAQRKNLFGEVVAVLEEGQQKGIISSTSPLIAEVLVPARREVSTDKASLPAQPSGVRGSGSSSVMMNFADVWLGYKDFDKAVAFYEAGLSKPGADMNRGHMGIGTARAYAGNLAAAKQAFAKVSGTRAPLAAMWQTWIEQQSSPAPAPAAPAATTEEPAG